jgi:hypothetical protein
MGPGLIRRHCSCASLIYLLLPIRRPSDPIVTVAPNPADQAKSMQRLKLSDPAEAVDLVLSVGISGYLWPRLCRRL